MSEGILAAAEPVPTVPDEFSPWVVRFNRTERAVHWVQAITFLILLVTGFILGISTLEALVGKRALVREIHLLAAFFFVFGPSLVALAGNRFSLGRDIDDVDRWSADDVRWLAKGSVRPNPGTPRQGRFNAGQKLNVIFTLYSTFAFGLTGLILWQNRRFPSNAVAQANTIHTYLAYLALAVFLGHLYLAVIHPATRQALHGIVFGTVRRGWSESHHPGAVQQPAPEPSLRRSTLLRSVTLLLIGSEGALLLVRFILEWLGANPTDAITQQYYAWSALPGTFANHSTGIQVFDLAALLWAGVAVSILVALGRGEALLPQTLRARLGGRADSNQP